MEISILKTFGSISRQSHNDNTNTMELEGRHGGLYPFIHFTSTNVFYDLTTDVYSWFSLYILVRIVILQFFEPAQTDLPVRIISYFCEQFTAAEL